jgi:uncharacterized protein YndB with AHSA1/START domain
MPMRLEVDVKSGWGPPDRWTCVPEVRYGEGPVALAGPGKINNSRSKTQRVTALRVTHRYGVPAGRVFDAWLDPAVARLWLFATASRPLAYVEIDAQVNGSFCFVDRCDGGDMTRYVGEYIEVVPPRRLVFALSAAKYAYVNTRVAVEIAALTKGSKLTLIHENVPRDHAEHMEGRWVGVLYGLGATLDSASTLFHDHQE